MSRAQLMPCCKGELNGLSSPVISAQVHIDNGVIKAEDLTAMIEELESYGSRGLGARIIAK